MKRWSLRARFLLVLIAFLIMVFAAITLVIVRHNSNTLKTNLVDESKSFAALATQPIGSAFELYQDSGTIAIQQQVNQFTSLDAHINQVEVVNTNGKQLFINDAAHPISVSASEADNFSPSYIHNKQGDLIGIVQPYIENFGIHRYAVVYGISYDSVNQSIQQIVNVIVLLSVGILLVALIIGYLLINRLFLRPVANVSRQALLISKGELDQQIQLGRHDEIGDLATAVNTMASSLKADIAKLTEVDRLKSEFLMITSHNLRTPLTTIEGYIDQIKLTKFSSQDLTQSIEIIAANVTRLKGFAEDVLTISTMEAGGQEIVRSEPVAMESVLRNIADEFRPVAKQKDLIFKATITTSAWASIEKSQFHSVLWNLLDNAYKFTPKAGTIELTATTSSDRLEITVKDTGIGIAAAEIPQLFTKFHRATDILVYDYEGTGIGLYIAKLLLKRYGGDITVQSIEGKGSSFTISLPTVSPPPKTPRTQQKTKTQ